MPGGESGNANSATEANFDPSALEEAIQTLYKGARSTKLAATALLVNLCTVHGISNCFVDELFIILQGHILPQDNCSPKNYYTARTLTRKLGLSYNSIHACPKGCVLFKGEHAAAARCPKYDESRYKDQTRQKFPAKVLRQFLIIPRLQRMFRSPSISKLLYWHWDKRSNREGGDNLVRHPCDTKAWHHFHCNVDPTFGNDARNVHFALAANGVNPFKQTKSTWSTWPVTLMNYNLFSWLSTKKFFMFLALLILGKQSVTSEVFDVYLEPLVEEFLQLWEGVQAYDVTQDVGSRTFIVQGVLMWTIHDFPGYGTVGGFAHQGCAAYPWYGPDLGAQHSIELYKQAYSATRRWLPVDHKYRSPHMKDLFNGEEENRLKPRPVTVDDQLRCAVEYEAWKEAGHREGAPGDPSKVHGIMKRSILYRLPYWKVRISYTLWKNDFLTTAM
jgi:hypothetical protein